MSAEQVEATKVVPEQRTPADVVELESRLRPFSCPTGLHSWCSSGARHEPSIQTGLFG